MGKVKLLIGASILLQTSTAVFAIPILQVDANGFLTGAKKVLVGNELYNVTFAPGYDFLDSPDGRCALIFDGCDSTDDFFFSEQDALAASAALLDQVFVDSELGNFDSDPLKVNGCGDDILEDPRCVTLTPFRYDTDGNDFNVLMSLVDNTEHMDRFFIFAHGSADTGGGDFDETLANYDLLVAYNWAIWSEVPEPPLILLFFTGMIGLVGFNKPRKKA